jgi:hypothetical protein
VLVPFTAGELDPRVLDAAIRIARAEGATLVPAYLIVVPFEFSLEAPLKRQVEVAMPLLEAVEHAALRAGVPVDARIERGRTPRDALAALWAVEEFDRVIAPAPVPGHPGLDDKDIAWILANAPCETLVVRTAPEPTQAGRRGAFPSPRR